MKIKKTSLKYFSISFLSSIILPIFIAFEAFTATDKVDKIYQKAYNFILDEKWVDARELLEVIISDHPKSAWVDDACFWKCYSLEKQERSPEKSFDCYKEFIEKYPESKWTDDAKSNMIRLAKKLSKYGKPEYEAIIRSLQQSEDEEISLAALHALQCRGDARALSATIKLFDATKKSDFRKKIVYVIGTFESSEAVSKLIDIARNDSETALRKEAIFWLGQQEPSKNIIKTIRDFVFNDPDPGVQKKAIFSLSQIDGEDSADRLIDIARKHKHAEVRQEAIFWIGQNGESQKVIAALEDFAMKDSDPGVQKKAIFSLSQLPPEKGLPVLIKIAGKHKNTEMRGQAIFWLGQNAESKKIINALKRFAINDPEPRIQKKAVFALSQVSDDNGLPMLLDIAKKHKNSKIRGEAIFWLGQNSNSDEIIKAIEKFALSDPEPSVQEKALFALSQVSGNKGIPALIKIAKKHPKVKLRKKAIFWLGQSEDERAMEAIEDILYNER